MPYIKQKRRDELKVSGQPQNAGELNYAITVLLLEYWQSALPANYQTINDIVGACCGAAHEFERRIVGKYEDQKIKENGDMYL
jgi:hypothetical protein